MTIIKQPFYEALEPNPFGNAFQRNPAWEEVLKPSSPVQTDAEHQDSCMAWSESHAVGDILDTALRLTK